MSGYQNNSIFWVETEKILANPFQPRREFEPGALEDLADSIRQYGVLQPLVVTRKEEPNDNGGYQVSYELIAGERRLRASRIAGLSQVPVIIRKQTDNKVRLELAIIENLQREDLNPIDRALAFEQLYKQFDLTHAEIGKRMGKSRVYVSNSLRLLSLPQEIKQGLISGKISEGHTRPLLMLSDKPAEQDTLYKEIIHKKMSVRDSEKIARKIAQDRVRKKEFIVDPRIRDYEVRLSENLGTRVQIEQGEQGGKITIDYFTLKDLDGILNALQKTDTSDGGEKNMLDRYISEQKDSLQKTASLNFLSSHFEEKEEIKKEGETLQEEKPVFSQSEEKLSQIEKKDRVVFQSAQKKAPIDNESFKKEPLVSVIPEFETLQKTSNTSISSSEKYSHLDSSATMPENPLAEKEFSHVIPEMLPQDVVAPIQEAVFDESKDFFSEKTHESAFVEQEILSVENGISHHGEPSEETYTSQESLYQEPQQNSQQVGFSQEDVDGLYYDPADANYQHYQKPEKKGGFFRNLFK